MTEKHSDLAFHQFAKNGKLPEFLWKNTRNLQFPKKQKIEKCRKITGKETEFMKTENDLKGNFTKIPNNLIRNPRLSPLSKTVYILIRSYSPSFPSYARILHESGIASRTTLSKCLNELKAKKFIRVIDSSKHRSNLYEFPIQPMDCPSPCHEPLIVQPVDPNKNNVIRTIEKEVESPTAKTVEDFEAKRIFAEAQ